MSQNIFDNIILRKIFEIWEFNFFRNYSNKNAQKLHTSALQKKGCKNLIESTITDFLIFFYLEMHSLDSKVTCTIAVYYYL